MSWIGHGYGSEWHLLRYLGRHRNLLDSAIQETIGCGELEWLDFGFDSRNPWHDAEWKGMDFLSEDSALQESWRVYWPQGAGIHNWDAVAKGRTAGGQTEGILGEAKANLEELRSECQARSKESLWSSDTSLFSRPYFRMSGCDYENLSLWNVATGREKHIRRPPSADLH